MIVITGGSGLLGANLALQWSLQHRQVVALYLEHPISAPEMTSVPCNLLDAQQTATVISALQPQWIIHCAAATNVDWCERNPEQAFHLNVEASRHLAASAKAVGSGFVYISTDSVFDGMRGGYREWEPAAPVNVYARSKSLGERAVAEELPESLIIRTNIYGWNLQGKSSLAEWMLGQLEQGSEVPGFRDVVFSPILVNQFADFLLEMMTLKLEGVFHVGAAEACSKYEFGQHLAEVFGLNRSLVCSRSILESALSAQRPLNTSLHTVKVEQALGHPLPRVRTGLERFKELRESGFAARLKAAGTKRSSQSWPC